MKLELNEMSKLSTIPSYQSCHCLRPCALFSMFLVAFFSPNLRGRPKKKNKMPKEKKHWLSVPDYGAGQPN